MKNEISRDDIMSMDEYAEVRRERAKELATAKRTRRI